eukprot:76137_1
MAEEKKQEYPNYIGKTNDIDKELSRLKKLHGDKYPKLYDREFEYVRKWDKDNSLATINIMTFNMLADGLTGIHVPDNAKHAKSLKKTFTDVPKQCLAFGYRGFRILEELTRNIGPDIICLQECDQFEFLLHYLSPRGFKGVMNPKSSSPCKKVALNHDIELPSDGVAMFYDTKRYECKEMHKYGKTIEKIEDPDGPDIPAISMVLTDRKSKKDFVVATCHLKSKKILLGEVIRLGQLQHLLPRLKTLSEKNNDIPVFLACDLNTDVHKSYSTVYDSIMFPENVSAHHKRPLKPNLPEDYVKGYGLNLWSAYYNDPIPNTNKKKNQEPKYTTWKKRAG